MRKLLVAVLATLMAATALAPMAMADPVGFDVDVDKYITATFNYAAVDFGNLEAGSSNTAALSVNYNVSVDTNYAYKVSALGTNFTDGEEAGHSFPIGNLKMDTNAAFGSLVLGSAKALTEASQDIDTGQTSAISYHGWWLSIPAAQAANSVGVPYTSTVTVTYTSSSP
jgi:hypothetical protein